MTVSTAASSTVPRFSPFAASPNSDAKPLSEWISIVSGEKLALPAPAPPVALPIVEAFFRSQSKPSTASQPEVPLTVASPFTPSILMKYCSGLDAGTGVAAEARDTWVVVTALAMSLATASVAAAPVTSNSPVCGTPGLPFWVGGWVVRLILPKSKASAVSTPFGPGSFSKPPRTTSESLMS